MQPDQKLWLVDDSEDILEYLSEDLGREFQTKTFTSAAEALETLGDTERPDVFVVDFRMPGMDGLQFIDQLRTRDPSLPVVMMTGAATKDMALRSLDLGVFAIIEKPCSAREITNLAQRAIAQARMTCITGQLLKEFQAFVHSINNWSDVTFQHIVKLEDVIYAAGESAKSNPKDAAEDMKIRRHMRLAEKEVKNAQNSIDTMLEEYNDLTSLTKSA